MKIRIVWVVFETSRNLRNFACPDSRKMAISKHFRRYFKKVALGQCKSGAFQAKFGQELKFGILMKIRIVWLVFETSRSLGNFPCPDSAKMAIFQYFRGYFRKVALGNVKAVGAFQDTKKFDKFCMSELRQNGHF